MYECVCLRFIRTIWFFVAQRTQSKSIIIFNGVALKKHLILSINFGINKVLWIDICDTIFFLQIDCIIIDSHHQFCIHINDSPSPKIWNHLDKRFCKSDKRLNAIQRHQFSDWIKPIDQRRRQQKSEPRNSYYCTMK